MAGEKIKLEEEAISEILVADTDWLTRNQVLRLGMLTVLRRRRKKKKKKKKKNNNNNNNNNNKCKTQQVIHSPQQVADYQTGNRLEEEIQISILLSVHQKL